MGAPLTWKTSPMAGDDELMSYEAESGGEVRRTRSSEAGSRTGVSGRRTRRAFCAECSSAAPHDTPKSELAATVVAEPLQLRHALEAK